MNKINLWKAISLVSTITKQIYEKVVLNREMIQLQQWAHAIDSFSAKIFKQINSNKRQTMKNMNTFRSTCFVLTHFGRDVFSLRVRSHFSLSITINFAR